jgi:hypothetical protein
MSERPYAKSGCTEDLSVPNFKAEGDEYIELASFDRREIVGSEQASIWTWLETENGDRIENITAIRWLKSVRFQSLRVHDSGPGITEL